jgi:hypothetical protein
MTAPNITSDDFVTVAATIGRLETSIATRPIEAAIVHPFSVALNLLHSDSELSCRAELDRAGAALKRCLVMNRLNPVKIPYVIRADIPCAGVKRAAVKSEKSLTVYMIEAGRLPGVSTFLIACNTECRRRLT